MSNTKSAHLQAMYARRREAEHNRIERTEAVNKYYDHWGKQTSRFENWTTPEYYKQAEEQLQHTKDVKEKQKKISERQQRLGELLGNEKKNYDLELQEKEKSRRNRRFIPTRTLEKMEANLQEEQKTRRRLELEAKLYGKWRHGVDDENLIFESKTDNEVLAKLNWLDKQVEGQLQREKDENQAKDRDLKMQQELNKTEELQKERQQIREQEIREIGNLQELHMQQLRERQGESDTLKEKEKHLRANLEELDKELELLEESYIVHKKPLDLGEAYNVRKIKLLFRKRAEVFRNQLKLCTSILDRTLDFAENPEVIRKLKMRLEKELETEKYSLSQIEAMYESEAKASLKSCEEVWQNQHYERYVQIKDILNSECLANKESLAEIMSRQNDLLEIRSTHLGVIENSGEKLKQLIQEEENSPRLQNIPPLSYEQDELQKSVSFSPRAAAPSHHRQGAESKDFPFITTSQAAFGRQQTHISDESHRDTFSSHINRNASSDTFSPRVNNSKASNAISQSSSNINRNASSDTFSPRVNDSKASNALSHKSSNSFNNLNLDGWQPNNLPHSSQRDLDSRRQYSQRSMQVVTEQTEANRPRFGRKHSGFRNDTPNSYSQPIAKESHNNLSPRCFDSHDCDDIDQASNSFNNLNLDGWQNNPHPTQRDRDSMRQNSQRSMQVVTPETEANRPRFGRKNTAWMN